MASASASAQFNGYTWATPATLSLTASASGSTVSASVTMCSGSSYWYGLGTLSLSINGSTVASKKPSFASHNATDSISGSANCGDGTIAVTATYTTSGNAYEAKSMSCTCYVSVSTWGYGSLNVSSTNITLGDRITVTAAAGKGNSIGSPTWSYNGGSGATGSSFDSIVLEPYCRNVTSGSFTFTICASQTYGGTLSRSITVKIPDNYKPVFSLGDIEYMSAPSAYSLYSYLLAGKNYPRLNFSVVPEPSDNTAPISVSVSSTATLTATNKNKQTVTLGTARTSLTKVDSENYYVEVYGTNSYVLDSYSAPSYNITLTITATDTRNRTTTVTITSATLGYVYSYERPSLTIVDVSRCNSSGTILPSGKYAYVQIYSSDASLELGKDSDNNLYSGVIINNVSYALTNKGNGYYSAIVGNGTLEIASQYNTYIFIRNIALATTYYKESVNYAAESPVSSTYVLGTMQMPISLYDANDGTVGISVGEQAYKPSGVTSKSFMSFAATAQMVAVDDNGANPKIVKVYDMLSTCPFPVGGIYLSADSTDPSNLWNNTLWEQIAEGRALVGVGTGSDANGNSMSFNVGDNSGEYSHQLTVNEMPSHSHSYFNQEGSCDRTKNGTLKSTGVETNTNQTSGATGGSQYHNNMIPSFGIYIWKRLS